MIFPSAKNANPLTAALIALLLIQYTKRCVVDDIHILTFMTYRIIIIFRAPALNNPLLKYYFFISTDKTCAFLSKRKHA